MKRLSFLYLVLILLMMISCGGGKAAVKESDPSRPAMKELRKGIGWYQKGCYHKSLNHLSRAHELFTIIDDLPGIAMSMNNIGNVYRMIGDSESAVLFFESSYSIYLDLINDDGAIQALSNKAAVLIHDGHLEEAKAVLATAQEIAGRSGKKVVSLLNNQGVLLTRKKAYAKAEEILMEARDALDPENHVEVATVSFSLGNLMVETGRYDAALEFYHKALAADRKSQFHNGIADDLAAIGTVYLRQDNHATAAKYFQRSVKIYAILENTEKVIATMELLEASSQAANVDITVTKYFINRWAKGDVLESPCR